MLVRTEWHNDDRQAVRDGRKEGAEAPVKHHGVELRKDTALGDVSLDANVRGHTAEDGWIDVRAYSDEQVERLIPQPVEQRREEREVIARIVEHCAERRVHEGLATTERRRPFARIPLRWSVERCRLEIDQVRRQRYGRIA